MSLKEESDRHAVNICNANVNEKYFKNFKDFPDNISVVFNYLFIPLFLSYGVRVRYEELCYLLLSVKLDRNVTPKFHQNCII